MGSGFAKRKKQMRDFQEQIAKMQDTIAKTEVVGSAAQGLVQIKLNGEYELLEVKLKAECVDPEDIEGLEALIRIAYKEAWEKIQAATNSGLPDLGALGSLGFGA